MEAVVIIVQEEPYNGNNKAWDALRLAGALIVEDIKVRISLLDKGIELGCQSYSVPENSANLGGLLKELIENGVEVQACGKALNDHGIEDEDLCEGVKRGSMSVLAGWIKESDTVIAA